MGEAKGSNFGWVAIPEGTQSWLGLFEQALSIAKWNVRRFHAAANGGCLKQA